jgi:outer membrane receptor protein involved in Fe transport
MSVNFPIGALLFALPSVLLAQAKPLIEEVIVTAQRVEENAQEVPISLSAFTDAQIEDRQIIGLLDVQLNSPNVSATDSNFGDRELSIRGLGNLLDTQGRTQNSVSYHVNEVPLDAPLADFYDLERLEVLRGPQGTLYGRDSTAGAVNAITNRPGFEGVQGEVSVEFGNYDLIRVRGAAELAASERFAVRVAGYKLDRDGYINNLAGGQVPGVDDDLDGRDVFQAASETRGAIRDYFLMEPRVYGATVQYNFGQH